MIFLQPVNVAPYKMSQYNCLCVCKYRASESFHLESLVLVCRLHVTIIKLITSPDLCSHLIVWCELDQSVVNCAIDEWGVVCRFVSTLKADILNITYDCYSQNGNTVNLIIGDDCLFSFAVNVNEQRIIAFLTEKCCYLNLWSKVGTQLRWCGTVNFTTVACRISSRLKWYKNYKNRLRLAKVIVKNKMLHFCGSLCTCHRLEVKVSGTKKCLCVLFWI